MEGIHQLVGQPPRRRGPGRAAQKDAAGAAPPLAPTQVPRHPGENAAFAMSETEANRDALAMLAAWRTIDVPEAFRVPDADAATSRAFANLFTDVIVAKSRPDVVSIFLTEGEHAEALHRQAPATMEAYMNAAGADRGLMQRVPDLWREVERDTAAVNNVPSGPHRSSRLFRTLGRCRLAARPANRLQNSFTERPVPVAVRVRVQRADDTPSEVVRRRFRLPPANARAEQPRGDAYERE